MFLAETRMHATNLKKTGSYARPVPAGPVTREPANVNLLRNLIDPSAALPLPLRAHGAGSAATDCNHTGTGTIAGRRLAGIAGRRASRGRA